MSTDKTGGKAFPSTGPVSEYGMTLRDYFAAQALNAVINMDYPMSDIGYFMKDGKSIGENYAICAYELADAMLEARTAAQAANKK